MKPVNLEIQAFGPFVERQYIDFEALSKDGIFLIKGETGSGKTTIFDALTFALYGGSSGEGEKNRNGRNDFEEWRCTQADAGTPTLVSFTFSVKGRKYRFTRKLVQKRVNLSAEYEACEIREDGAIAPFFNNPRKEDLNKKAEEIIGLTKEQFRQVVLLPQGQFERFLTASSSEKEGILQQIFNTTQWEAYAQAVFDATKKRKDVLDLEKQDIARSLAEEGLEDLEELQQRLDRIREEKKEEEARHKAFDGEERRERLEEDMRLFEQFKPLHVLEKKAMQIEELQERMAGKRSEYEEASRAESIRRYIEKYEECRKADEERSKELKERRERLPEMEKLAAEAEKEMEAQNAKSPVAELQRKQGEYESKREIYMSCFGLEDAFEKAAARYLIASRDLEAAQESWQVVVKKSTDLLKDRNQAEKEAIDYRTRYFSGIYGELAGDLSDHEKCPVCGSLSHPEPAVKTPDGVTREEWDQKEESAEKKKKAWEKAEEDRRKKEKLKEAAAVSAAERLKEKERAGAELQSAQRNLIDGIPDADALCLAMEQCENEIDAFQRKIRALSQKSEMAGRRLSTWKDALKIAEAEKEKTAAALAVAKESLCCALSEHGRTGELEEECEIVKALLVSDEVRTKMQEEIVNYETSRTNVKRDLEAKREELRGKIEPDQRLFSGRQKEIDEENRAFTRHNAEKSTELQRLEKKLFMLEEKQKHYESGIYEAESDLAFAKRLRGDSGVGLQRYVLAVMFNQVIGEANRMLEHVHGGRYRLFRSNEKGTGNKRGLELKVFDSRSPENEAGRGVAMLSGGEKFLVSLAMSIGMSSVAQRSGVQIDALFVDEGFGTLDERSIYDAMDVLEHVRKGSGTIGLISHVALLESTITAQLNVIKEKSGSRIRTV